MQDIWILRMAHSNFDLDTISKIAGKDAWSVLYRHGVVERAPQSVTYGYDCAYRPVPTRWLELFEEHDSEMPQAVRDAIALRGG